MELGVTQILTLTLLGVFVALCMSYSISSPSELLFSITSLKQTNHFIGIYPKYKLIYLLGTNLSIKYPMALCEGNNCTIKYH